MELTRKQFDVLSTFAESKQKLSQRQLEEMCNYSLGTINKVVKELSELGFIGDGEITPAGINALEPYRAKKAIFIAAGFGSRMVPVTLNTPKPLIRVNGKRIIDTLNNHWSLEQQTTIQQLRDEVGRLNQTASIIAALKPATTTA